VPDSTESTTLWGEFYGIFKTHCKWKQVI
jgi:hypothetical protein